MYSLELRWGHGGYGEERKGGQGVLPLYNQVRIFWHCGKAGISVRTRIDDEEDNLK